MGRYQRRAASHAFLYSGGSMQDLGALARISASEALGINDSGQVVGIGTTDNCAAPSCTPAAVLWTT